MAGKGRETNDFAESVRMVGSEFMDSLLESVLVRDMFGHMVIRL